MSIVALKKADKNGTIAIEDALLGALLLDCSQYPKVAQQLDLSDFHSIKNRSYFVAMGEVFKKYKKFDVPILVGELDLDSEEETELYDYGMAASSISNIDVYASIVKDKSIARNKLIPLDEEN